MFMAAFPVLETSAKSQKSIAQDLKALGDELVVIVVVLAYPLRTISVPSSDEHSDRLRSSRLSACV